MAVDYFSLLTKAIAGKDAAGRDRIYRDAYGVIARSNLTPEVSASHIAALEDAIRRIENRVADQESRGQKSAAEISQVLSTSRNWKPFIIGAVRSSPPPRFRRCCMDMSHPGHRALPASPRRHQNRSAQAKTSSSPTSSRALMAARRAKDRRLLCSGRWFSTAPQLFLDRLSYREIAFCT